MWILQSTIFDMKLFKKKQVVYRFRNGKGREEKMKYCSAGHSVSYIDFALSVETLEK